MSKTKAEREASKLWETGGRTIPVNVEKLADLFDIEIVETELEEDVSGMMVTREDSSVAIVVNASHHEHRKRFTIAHELGHYRLHRTISPIFVDSKKTFFRDSQSSQGINIQEIEANQFAAELLMPEGAVRFREPMGLSLMDTDKLEQLAIEFNVSQIALSYRFMKLGLLEEI